MALYYEKGTISFMSEIESGQSKSGRDWARMTLCIDVPGYQGTYRKLALRASNQVLDDVLKFQLGARVEVGFSIVTNEYNGKFYNNVDLVTIKGEGQPAPAPQMAAPAPQTQQQALYQRVQNAMGAAQRPAYTPPVAPNLLDPSKHNDLPFD